MRCFSVAATGLLLFMAWPITAHAADLYGGSYKDSPAPAPFVAPFRWTGFYLGGDVGGAWARGGDVSSRCSPAGVCLQRPAGGNVDANSFIGGVHAGYNWAIAPKWIGGVEGDFMWTGLDGSTSAPDVTLAGGVAAPVGHSWSRDVSWLASIRGRIGYTVAPKALWYFTGGVAWQEADYAATQINTPGSRASTSFSQTTTGYVLGSGLEWAMTKNWVIRGEYLYYNFEGESASAPHSAIPARASFKWDDSEIHSLRAGISYKF
jgi:outer membrane immunogenic protein